MLAHKCGIILSLTESEGAGHDCVDNILLLIIIMITTTIIKVEWLHKGSVSRERNADIHPQ